MNLCYTKQLNNYNKPKLYTYTNYDNTAITELDSKS